MSDQSKTINVGILGHVDSGKTSLCKSISQVGSTASFDKHPESKRKGITIDLGFSMFNIEDLQVCLVDCPGHASLIRTIIGGSQIIDMMILVVDANKGIETQTAESIVISQVLKKPVVIVLNKMDLYTKGDDYLRKLQKSLRKISKRVVCLSAKNIEQTKIDELNNHILQIYNDSRLVEQRESINREDFLFMFDHCFSIKGKGTVLTGTILRGTVNVNDNLFVSPNFLESFKIKTIQRFRQPVNSAKSGERVGILLGRFSKNKKNERSYATKNKDLLRVGHDLFFEAKFVKYYRDPISSRTKFHFSIGHETVMGMIIFFDQERNFIPVIDMKQKKKKKKQTGRVFALVKLEKMIPYYPGMVCIGSKLDTPIHRDICRIGFYGIVEPYPEQVEIFRTKERYCVVDRVIDSQNVLGRGLLRDKKGDLTFFIGKKVELAPGVVGEIVGKFGKSGKFKVHFPGSSLSQVEVKKGMRMAIKYKVNIFEKSKEWIQ